MLYLKSQNKSIASLSTILPTETKGILLLQNVCFSRRRIESLFAKGYIHIKSQRTPIDLAMEFSGISWTIGTSGWLTQMSCPIFRGNHVHFDEMKIMVDEKSVLDLTDEACE